MVFAGYRLPKPISAAGTVLGTNSSAQYTIGATDPALYRNILTVTLSSATSPTVTTATSEVTANPPAPVVGQPVSLSATVAVPSPGAGTPVGMVTFSGAGGALCTGSLDDASPDTASCTYTYTGATTDTITATYTGDANFAGSAGPGTALTVGRDATSTTEEASPSSPVVGEPVTYTATVSVTAPGSGTPTGTVTFAGDAGPLCPSAPLDGGGTPTATCTTSYAAVTSDSVTATYNGDANDAGSFSSTSVTVGQAATSTTVAASASPAVIGQPITFTATVASTAPGMGTPAGSVTFTLRDAAPTKGAGHLGPLACTGGDTVALAGGTAQCVLSGGLALSQSPATVEAAFAGSTSFAASTSTPVEEAVVPDGTTVTISAKANPTLTGRGAHLTAIVAAAAPGSGAPTGTATWTITSADDTAVPCSGGSTTVNKTTGATSCSVGANQLSAADGPYTVSVSYSGDADFLPSTGTFTQTISPAASETRITVSPPARSGSPGIVTARVTGDPTSAGTPTGSVTFSILGTSGPAVECAAGDTIVLVSGAATCHVPTGFVSVGSPYTVSATYHGDGNFTPSTSSSKTFHVR